MSVFIMLYVFWEAIVGLLCVLASIWYFFAVLHDEFGKRAVAVVLGVIGAVLIGFWVHSWGDAERSANGFLYAWSEASADYPHGRALTPEWFEFLDTKRIRNLEGYFPNWNRLVRHTPAQLAGKEMARTDLDPSPVPCKVFVSSVFVHDNPTGKDYTAALRIWIARDNERVVNFMFEDVVFQK